MGLNDVKDFAAHSGYVCYENTEYLGVACDLFVTTQQHHQTSGPYWYAGFDHQGNVIAIGNEEGDNRCGGWVWVRKMKGGIPPKLHPMRKLWEQDTDYED